MRDTNEYKIPDAIKRVKETSKTKFDASVETHINLDIDPTKQIVRFLITLPHGTGKTQRIAVLSDKKVEKADINLSEADLSKIEKGDIKPGTDFDIFITQPKFMPKVAKIAKILGPVGLMPNPKNGTVAENIEKAVEEFKAGKVEIRTEQKAPIIHIVIGKVSFGEKELEENLQEIIKTLKQNKPQKAKPSWIKSIFLTSSMGPSIKLSLED
ncbi:50S ribosomal protein L1 [Patescibacteria group bacterium]|nr:50S ribosomal protein L1 [Patescibacteria group bacterium]